MWWKRLSPLILALASGCGERASESKATAPSAPPAEVAASAAEKQQSEGKSESRPPAKTELAKAESLPKHSQKPDAKLAAKKQARIPTPLDPAIQKLASKLLEADADERAAAAKTLAAMKYAAIPYLLEVFLDDENLPREPVSQVLAKVWTQRGFFQDAVHPEATKTLLEALTYPNPAMRRGAAAGLYVGIYDPKDTGRSIEALRGSSVNDIDASVRRQSGKILQIIAADLVNVMTEPFANPRNDVKHFATLVSIGENALAALNQGVAFVDTTVVEIENLERIRRGIGAAGMDPLVRQRLLRLIQWRTDAGRTIDQIRNDPRFGR